MTVDSLKDFERYQEVKNVYRLQDGQLTLVYHPFTEDWGAARRREKAKEMLGGQFVTYSKIYVSAIWRYITCLQKKNCRIARWLPLCS